MEEKDIPTNNMNEKQPYIKPDPLDDNDTRKDESVTNGKQSSEDKQQTSIKTDSYEAKSEESLVIFPKKPSINKSGQILNLASNYFPFVFSDTTKNCFFKYALEFQPEIPGDSANLRKRLIGKARDKIIEIYGNFLFNNTVIFSAENRPEPKDFFAEFDNIKYTISIKWANYVDANSTEALPVYKKFFFSLLGHMNFIQFKKNYFNKELTKKLQEIEIWPGFNPSINLYEGKVLLNLNTLSKVIRTENALDYLMKLNSQYNNNQNEFQTKANEDFKNMSVLTRYNNDKTFTVDSVNFSLSPKSTFETKNGPISYIDYYKKKYNREIRDQNQPLLVSTDKKTKKPIHLIPEFCYLTGLTDEMRGNFNFMKQVTQYTIGQAHNKMIECIGLVKNIIENSKCKETVQTWGMSISDKPISVTARKLDPGSMIMKGNNQIPIDNTNDIDRRVQTEMYKSPNIQRWMIFYSRNVKDVMFKSFIPQFQSAISTFRFNISQPKIVEIPSTRVNDWQRELNDKVLPGTQFALIVMPGARGKGFFYNEVKTLFTSRFGIPSQIILEGTLKKDRGLRSVINKVLIQICAKMGGEPWIINNIPCRQHATMIISFCLYKDIITSCGTCNDTFSRYISKTVPLPEPSQQRDKIMELFKYQIAQFQNMSRQYPVNIIILRDGVAPSLTKAPIEEIKGMKKIISELTPTSKLTYILINKKHNLKVVLQQGDDRYSNIPSGTLIDNAVVGNEYEFFLVSQKATQGISQATQYKIIFDDIGLKPEDIHLLTYKMCFLYYNWTGGIKTPAPAHYAKKLAFLVGDKMTSKGNISLPNDNIKSLYFL